jgi:hypothetical protein
MYKFDGNNLTNLENGKSVIVGNRLDRVQEALGVTKVTVVPEDLDLVYFTLDKVQFGELTGKVFLDFHDNFLFNMDFTPDLNYFRDKSIPLPNRDAWYDSVSKTFKYLCEQLQQIEGTTLIYENNRYKSYKIDNREIVVSIDRDFEHVCVEQREYRT